jgi:catechol 2,3-dioxygenase-like lactoylglutathione lyase family enzyme
MKIHPIDHVGIIVNDLPAAKAFFLDFGQVLGARLTKVDHGPVDSRDFLESDAVYSDAK